MCNHRIRVMVVTAALCVAATDSIAMEQFPPNMKSSEVAVPAKHPSATAPSHSTAKPPSRESWDPATLLAALGLGGLLVIRRTNLHQ